MTAEPAVVRPFPLCDPFPHALTEVGAAQRFADEHSDDVRFDWRRQGWLWWEGHRWCRDADAVVVRLAIVAVRRWQRDALEIPDQRRKQEVLSWACRLETHAKIQNVLALVKCLAPIATSGDQWDHDPWLLGVLNGVVDLRTGALRAGRREDQITMAAGVPFDPATPCPRWTRFLSEVFGGDPALTDFVQRVAGYALTGITSEQFLLLGYGPGANGKTTLLRTLTTVWGDYAYNMPFSTIEVHQRSAIPNDLAALAGRRLIAASETNDGTRINESRVKALTGSDSITARFLHSEFFTFVPVGKFFLSVNHRPEVRDDSYAFWRRMRLVPFGVTFPLTPGLADELAAEGPGILHWALEGCLRWQAEGFVVPAAVAAATDDYQLDQDPLAEFLTGACHADPAAELRGDELFQLYKDWANQRGLSDKERLKATRFALKLQERYPSKRRNYGRVYFGLARGQSDGLLLGK